MAERRFCKCSVGAMSHTLFVTENQFGGGGENIASSVIDSLFYVMLERFSDIIDLIILVNCRFFPW